MSGFHRHLIYPLLYYPVQVETRHTLNYFDAREFQAGKHLPQKWQRYFHIVAQPCSQALFERSPSMLLSSTYDTVQVISSIKLSCFAASNIKKLGGTWGQIPIATATS